MPRTEYRGDETLRRGDVRFDLVYLPEFGELTPNDTTYTAKVPVMRESVVLGGTISCSTVGSDADGTILIYLCKRDKASDSEVVLSEGLNAEALVTDEAQKFTLLSTLTDRQQTVMPEDVIYAKAVSNSAGINTQPTNLIVGIDLARRK